MDPYIVVQSECFSGSHGKSNQPQVALTYILIQGAPGTNQKAGNGEGQQQVLVVLPSAFQQHAVFTLSLQSKLLVQQTFPSWSVTCAMQSYTCNGTTPTCLKKLTQQLASSLLIFLFKSMFQIRPKYSLLSTSAHLVCHNQLYFLCILPKQNYRKQMKHCQAEPTI